eukprot:7950710-Alexandrium_andersonii.AAC.1
MPRVSRERSSNSCTLACTPGKGSSCKAMTSLLAGASLPPAALVGSSLGLVAAGSSLSSPAA